MDIHQLKTFVVVAREGSITRASELLHLSQPAVSAHIKAIERTPRGMSLTAGGKRLFAKAEQALPRPRPRAGARSVDHAGAGWARDAIARPQRKRGLPSKTSI